MLRSRLFLHLTKWLKCFQTRKVKCILNRANFTNKLTTFLSRKECANKFEYNALAVDAIITWEILVFLQMPVIYEMFDIADH